MSEQYIDAYLGEIRMFAGNFPPRDWAFCSGQLLPIMDHQALFSVLGTMYGGDGRTTFALPDLRGRMPLHSGNGDRGPGLSAYQTGQRGGTETVALTASELPAHSHRASLQTFSDKGSAEGKNLAASGDAGNAHAVDVTTDAVGGAQPHNNLPPYTAVNFIICLEGVYPPRS